VSNGAQAVAASRDIDRVGDLLAGLLQTATSVVQFWLFNIIVPF